MILAVSVLFMNVDLTVQIYAMQQNYKQFGHIYTIKERYKYIL